MDHRLNTGKSALAFICLVIILFGTLALLPVMAQPPPQGPAGPGSVESGEASSLLLRPSYTGYIVDNSTAYPYFVIRSGSGGTDGWTHVSAGLGQNGDYLYAQADNNLKDYVEWHPDLQAGWYEVFVHYVAHPNRRSDAQYIVRHAGGTSTVMVNQQNKNDGTPAVGEEESGWVRLGVYRFQGFYTQDFVRLGDSTTPSGTPTPGYVVADAVKFSPLDVWVDDDLYCPTCYNDGKLWGVNAFTTIQEGTMAVGSLGTINVKPGSYTGAVTLTKQITLASTGGAASTSISVTNDSAVQILADNVMVRGFTVKSHTGARGITNRDDASAVFQPVVGVKVLNNIVHSFQNGIQFRKARGEISGNQVYGNRVRGIYLREYPTASPGGFTVLNNVLSGNGNGGSDHDIRLEDVYTGTLVMSNTITGGMSEACILVYNEAGSVELTGNTLNACSEGVLILQDGGTAIIQQVKLQRNTITGGGTGVRVRRISGTSSLREVIIGGSAAAANRIYGNTSYELRLTGYGANITATYNYWGWCNLRDIENEIYHEFDSAPLGLVTYEPALCVPWSLTMGSWPTVIPGDGVSTATITATVLDGAGQPVPAGTMVGLTTTLGSIAGGYAEAESPDVVTSGVWGWGADAHASGGAYGCTNDPTAVAHWEFYGSAVSFIYVKDVGGGLADVYVDNMSTPVKTIDMSSAFPGGEWGVEEVIKTGLSATGVHSIEVRMNAASPGPIWADAFRAGGTVGANGQLLATLRSTPISNTATIWGSVYNGRIILAATPPTVYPFLMEHAHVTFMGSDVWVRKSASVGTVSPGKEITYTITYGNLGAAVATGTVVTDALPDGFLLVRTRSTPTLPAYTVIPPLTYTWPVGNLAPGATGVITLVAKPDPAYSWPSTPELRTNVALIDTQIFDGAAGNDGWGETVSVVPNPPAVITVTAFPTEIMADGVSTAVITAEVKDMYHHPVLDGTAVNMVTSLPGTVFLPGGTASFSGVTLGGLVVTTLQGGTVAGTTFITATSGTAKGAGRVQVLALEPYSVTITANPMVIPVSHGNISTTLRVTVTDIYANLVSGAAVTLTTDAGSLRAPNGATGTGVVITTSNGFGTGWLASTETVMTATVTAEITTTGRPTATVQVYFKPGLPYTITSAAFPASAMVCGGEAVVTATISDEFGNLVEDGTEVNFNIVQGERGDAYPRLTSTVNGIATTVVRTKSYMFGQPYLDVYILARRETRRVDWQHRLTLLVGLADSVAFRFTPTPSANGPDSIVEARVRDCAGNNVANGTVVTFTVGAGALISPTVTTTDGGFAYSSLRCGCTVGPLNVSAEADGRTFSTVVVIEPGIPDRVSLSISPTDIMNCGGTAVVTGTVRDVCNNLVRDNTPVLLTPQYGMVSLSQYLLFTKNGIVTATVRANQNKRIEPPYWPSGLEQIIGTSGTAMPGFVNLNVRPGAASIILVSVDPAEIPLNGDVNGYNITVVANVQDCSTTPVEDGTTIRLKTDKGLFLESGNWFVDLTTLNGLVTATLTSQSVAGTVVISGTSGSAVGTAKAYFKPGDPWLLEVWAYPPTIVAGGHTSTQVTARVFDEYHNDVGSGVTVTFVTDYGHFQDGNSMYTTTTALDGMAFAILTSDVVPHTALVRAITPNYRQGYTYVFFTEPPVYHYLNLPLITRRRFMP